jgi:hypothetical protein
MNGGVAFGFIALGFAFMTLWRLWTAWIRYRETLLGNRRTLSDPHHHRTTILLDPQEVLLRGLYMLVPLVIILLIAALLAWLTYKRPSLLLCTIALLWVLLQLVGAVATWGAPSDVTGVYCALTLGTVAALLGTVAGLGGVRGAWAARRFRQSPPEFVL